MDEERQAGRQAFPAGWGINGGLGRVMTVSAFWLYTISPVAVVMVMARRREVSIPVSQLLQGECKLSPGISPVEGVAVLSLHISSIISPFRMTKKKGKKLALGETQYH